MTADAIRVAQDANGVQFKTFYDGSARHCQGVALVDSDGNHVGSEDNGLHVTAISFEHFELHEGDSFHFSEVITLGSAATQNYLLTVADTTKWPHFSYYIEGSYGVTVELYEGADRAGTAAQTAYDRNRNTDNTPGMTIHKGTSGGTTDGTRIVWLKSGTGTAGGRQSGTSGEATERILKQNTKYLFRITSAAASNDITVAFNWYEHTFAA